MITVHHLNNSRSQRVLWLLEEMGLKYEVKRYQRDARNMLAPPELRAVHPLGKSPVITDDGRTLAESGAIIEYLVERYGDGRLAPAAGTPEQLRYRYWLHYAEGSIMPLLVMKLIFSQIPKAPMPFFVKPVARRIVDGVDSAFLQCGRRADELSGRGRGPARTRRRAPQQRRVPRAHSCAPGLPPGPGGGRTVPAAQLNAAPTARRRG
jgi:glutathione S-transferase